MTRAGFIRTRKGTRTAMKTLISATASTMISSAALAQSQITRAGTQPASIGAGEYFTGTVLVQPVFGLNADRNFSSGSVTFLPGARSNWHSHPHGQTLVVTSGAGWTQAEGEARVTINAGDVVWCPPGIRHWHGATDSSAMTHLAIQQAEDTSVVDWMEPVTEAQYLGQ